MIPADQLTRITEYREASDGPSKTLAYVESNRGVGDEWMLTVDPVDAYRDTAFYQFDKLIVTLVHEFGHALTLDNYQIDHHFGRFSCPEGIFVTLEGCALPDSYLQKFVTQFWTPYLSEFYAIQGDTFKLAGFYLNHQTDFINRYASTDPVEDIAESFAGFVILPDPRGTSTAGSVANQKIAFFYQYPELVQLRNDMRGRLAYILSVLPQ
jgi:hypothetical protein